MTKPEKKLRDRRPAKPDRLQVFVYVVSAIAAVADAVAAIAHLL